MRLREPLSVEQTDKVLLIAVWLSRMSTLQREIQMAERWDRLDDLRRIYQGLSKYLIRIIDGSDDLDSNDWEQRLFSRLIKPEGIIAHKESVEAGVKGAIYDLFEKPRVG
jgi:hypothetical protein